MANVLFIKTSSLGDVVHHMPALAEARARRPADRFTWVVEEAFAPLVRLHPAADRVVPVAMRRWRGAALLAPPTWSEIARFRQELRATAYDEIVDTQGLFKSALIARAAHGRRHGYDADSIKEAPASWLYDVRHRVSRSEHAIVRNRALTGLALGYGIEGSPDYGLDRARLAAGSARYAVLLHATAHRGKEWPEPHWRALAEELGREIDLVLPYGSEAERARSERIAAGIARAQVPERRPLDQMARLIAGASFVVGVDTGLLHIAAALGVPLAGIFTGSEPGLTGPMGQGPIAVLGGMGARPSVEEVRRAVQGISG